MATVAMRVKGLPLDEKVKLALIAASTMALVLSAVFGTPGKLPTALSIPISSGLPL